MTNVTLAPPNTAGAPVLWPLQLYTAPATNFSMADVRMVVRNADFKAYLDFFRANDTGAVFYTVGCCVSSANSWKDCHDDSVCFTTVVACAKSIKVPTLLSSVVPYLSM